MKEKLFNTAKYLLLAAALGQLALSQIHIGIITKVFSPSVGFFLFLYIISGLVTAFNAASMNTDSTLIIILGGCSAAVITGCLYFNILMKDIQAGNLLTMGDALFSLVFTIITMVIYLCGTLVMVATRHFDD